MKFGIFYEHQLPRPWERHREHRAAKVAASSAGDPR